MTNAVPLLTVVMPVHNGAAYLGAALESIGPHPHGMIELIILDSSADDSCGAIVRAFGDCLPIRYEHCPDMLPWTQKTNAAVAIARSDYVAMLHQDDLWLPGRFAAIQNALAFTPDARVILSAVNIIDETGRTLGQWNCPFKPNKLLAPDDIIERLLVQNFIGIPSPVISRSAWLDAGGMDTDLWYTADWDLYLKLAAKGKFVYLPQSTAAFRIHGQSQTILGSRDPKDFRNQLDIVIERYVPRVKTARRSRTLRLANASATINTALASGLNGGKGALPAMLFAIMAAFIRLLPMNIFRYFRYSRIIERVLPRLRALRNGAI